MNEAEQRIATQRALNAERQARISNTSTSWVHAARLWRMAGDNDKYNECILAAAECKS